jgi:hypothetical protein
MTQLAQLGLNRLNIVSQPYQSYTLATFNTTQWGALLELATYIEVLKHLRRSYVEQPDVRNASLGYLDRRDYMQRWGEILRDEQEDLKDALEIYKIAAMGLGRPSVLISGGAFGNWGPTRLPGSAVARPYYMGFF